MPDTPKTPEPPKMGATDLTFQYDAEAKALTIITPGGNRIIVSDTANSLSIVDGNDNRVTLDATGISLESAGNLNLHARGNISLAADGNLALDAKTALSARAGTTAELSGNVGAKLSACGETVIKGGIVLIN